MKKVTWQQFIRMNTRKRVVLMFGSMFLALVVVTGAVFALAQYSGILGQGEIKNPSDPKNDLFTEAFVRPTPWEPSEDGSPFPEDGSPITNPNPYPIVLRASLKKILTTYKSVRSNTLDVPSTWKPAVLSDAWYEWFQKESVDFKEVPYESILWNEDQFGTKPANLHIKYFPSGGGFVYYIYLEIKDAAGNFVGLQLVDNLSIEFHTRDETTINTVWFNQRRKPEYLFYVDDPAEMLQAKIQWAAFASGGEGVWAADASWETVCPTKSEVVKSWSDTVPMVALQSKTYYSNFSKADVGVYLKAPELRQTLTPKQVVL